MLWVNSQIKSIFPANEAFLFSEVVRLLKADDNTFAALGSDWFERTLLYKYRIGFTSMKQIGQSVALNLAPKELIKFADYPVIIADDMQSIKTRLRKAYIITVTGESKWHVFN